MNFIVQKGIVSVENNNSDYSILSSNWIHFMHLVFVHTIRIETCFFLVSYRKRLISILLSVSKWESFRYRCSLQYSLQSIETQYSIYKGKFTTLTVREIENLRLLYFFMTIRGSKKIKLCKATHSARIFYHSRLRLAW